MGESSYVQFINKIILMNRVQIYFLLSLLFGIDKYLNVLIIDSKNVIYI